MHMYMHIQYIQYAYLHNDDDDEGMGMKGVVIEMEGGFSYTITKMWYALALEDEMEFFSYSFRSYHIVLSLHGVTWRYG